MSTQKGYNYEVCPTSMYEGLLEKIQHLYLYGSVTRLYGISIQYWMKLGWIKISFPYLIHACMEEAISRFWKGSLICTQGRFLLRVAEEWAAHLCGGQSKGMWIVDAGGWCKQWLQALGDSKVRLRSKGQHISMLKLQRCSKLLLSSFVSCVLHCPFWVLII